MAGLTSTRLGGQEAFNWIFLIDILVCGILALFFLFYFNRLFATLVSYAIRAWTWHKYRAYIDISALQISLLGGRIFFKDVRYHGHNITLLVHEGMITWRYWLRSVQEAEIFAEQDVSHSGRLCPTSVEHSEDGSKVSNDEKHKGRSRSVSRAEKAGGNKKPLPCRISIKVTAVEAFIYNQSPVYDNIIQAALRKSKHAADFKQDELSRGENSSPTSPNGIDEKMDAQFVFVPQPTDTQNTSAASQAPGTHILPDIPAWLRILPIRIECKRAAAAVGNENTTSIITAKVERATGTIDAGHAGPLDYYKLLFDFALENVVASMKPNRDFKSRQLDAARRILRDKELDPNEIHSTRAKVVRPSTPRWYSFKSPFHRQKSHNGSLRTASMTSVNEPPPAFQQDQVPGESQWRGLTRYLDDRDPTDYNEWDGVEYAKSSTLVDCNKIDFKFYFDMPGTVPNSESTVPTAIDSASRDINGSQPPEYGLEFGVHGGSIVYGPWADRQRVNLQQVFFPVACVDSVPKPNLMPGETRVWTEFKIFVVVEDDVMLRIPTRESSKDGRWQGRAHRGTEEEVQEKGEGKKRHGRKQKRGKRQKGKQASPQIDVRPYAWIDVKVLKDTTVNYNMAMFADENGFSNRLDLDVKGTEMTSSVNHDLLWRAGALTLEADLSNPCTWNTLRSWPFTINCDGLELFILRDHMFLITDVVNDWSTGPPPEFFSFVPYHYSLDLTFRNFVMYLNVNDANIISSPADLDKNDFLTLEGDYLHGVLGIPLEHFRPKRSGITFDVLAEQMRMRLLNPPRSTLKTLLHDKQVADLPKLTLKGSYSANAEVGPEMTDVLRMDIVGTGLNLKAYGFLVRLLINLKENYFGDYIHFKTLEEFQDAGDSMEEANVKTATVAKPQPANELDVILCIIVQDAAVLFPTSLYSSACSVRLEVPVANLDLRVTSYYLDMGLDISPISMMSSTSTTRPEQSSDDIEGRTQMYISHVNLYGFRAFGPPPVEPAYACEWNINVGTITGECSTTFIHDAALAGQAFVFTFRDGENMLPVTSPNIFYDITFVQVRTGIIRVWLHAGDDAILVSTNPISVESNDWSGKLFSQRVSVRIPLLTLACVDAKRGARQRIAEKHASQAHTYAFLQTGIELAVAGRKAGFSEERAKQQVYLRLNDARTGRAPFLQRQQDFEREAKYEEDPEFDPPAMQLPRLPSPIGGDGPRQPLSIKSSNSFATPKGFSRRHSSSSLSSSIRKNSSDAAPTAGKVTFRPLEPRHNVSSRSSVTSSRSAWDMSNNVTPIQSTVPTAVSSRGRIDVSPATIAFTSPFAAPYSPLDQIEPDESRVPAFEYLSDRADDEISLSSILLPDVVIESDEVSQEFGHTSVFIKLVPGLRIFAEPRMAETVVKLIDTISPKTPETVMDAFQMKVMGEIDSRQAARHGTKTVLEIQCSLPSARLRVMNLSTMEDTADPSWDRLDVTIRGLEQTVRVRAEPTAQGAKQTLVLHTLSESLDVSLGEVYQDGRLSEAAVEANISDILVWVAIASTSSIHVSVRDTQFDILGEQAKYLAQLTLRLMPTIQTTTSRFDEVLHADHTRLLCLIHTLTRHSEDVSDPPFLSRMVYILRAFPDHYRNQESWKILSRFRQILGGLSDPARNALESECVRAELDSPVHDVQAEILRSWAQWRNWDVPNVGQTLVFRNLFDLEEEISLDVSSKKPLALTVRAQYTRVALSKGESVSEIVIEDTSIALEDSPPTAPTGLMLVDENMRTKTQLQIHTSIIAIALDWAIYEVAEMILPLADKLAHIPTSSKDMDIPHRRPGEVLEDEIGRHDFHIVLSTEGGSITLKTINLQLLSRTEGLKMSLIGTTQADEVYGQCASALVNAERAVTELYGPNAVKIWQTLLASPSIYVDHLQPRGDVSLPPTVTLAAAYTDLEIAVVEQMPGILRIIDLIIVDEVAKIKALVDNANVGRVETLPAPMENLELLERKAASGITTPKFSIALLAGMLHFEVSLLSTLNYHLEGTAASIRVAPTMTDVRLFDIDFDIGQQQHSFVNLSANQRHEEDIFVLPPVNGHTGVEIGAHETSVSIAMTVEKVNVDAAAIQRVIAVVNQPEVQNVISAIKGGVDDIKDHVQELDGKEETPEKPTITVTHRIFYDVRFALLGIRVAASTPQLRENAVAEVEFGIGPLHAKASNRATSEDSNPLIPQVHAQIRNIGASLTIIEQSRRQQCGNVTLSLSIHFDSKMTEDGTMARELTVRSNSLDANAYPDTASIVVGVINHLQDRIKELDLSKELEYLRHLRDSRRGTVIQRIKGRKAIAAGVEAEEVAFTAADLLSVQTTIELRNIQISWLVGQKFASTPDAIPEDAVLTLSSILFTTRGGNEAKLTIQDLLVQLTQERASITKRSLNSALLPEIGFSVAYWSRNKNWSLACKATGEPLDLQLESRFIIPVSGVQRSVSFAMESFKRGTATWQSTTTSAGTPRKKLIDTRRLASLLVEADFAGAQVYVQGSSKHHDTLASLAASSQQQHGGAGTQHGRYGQFAPEGRLMHTTLKAPGMALKLEYNRNDRHPTINGEMQIDASRNMLLPNVVPLVLEVTESVKDVMKDQSEKAQTAKNQEESTKHSNPRFFEEDSIVAANPSAIFGKTKVNLGLRIRRQEFGLSCQPIARVDATAALDDLYFTVNTIDSGDYGHFFAISAVVTKLTAQVKHMYSREPTFSYDMESIVLSLMNSKHLSGVNGVSAILKFNPTKITINGKQLQDLLLFREIWLPPEIRQSSSNAQSPPVATAKTDDYIVQRYKSVAAAAAFPWNATVSIAQLGVELDLGQSIGKSSFTIADLWASQQKDSNWEQNLCIGMEEMAIASTGRMSGFVELSRLGVRTSIKWPEDAKIEKQTPLIQASVGFQRLRAKAAFDYQAFAFGDIEGFDFLMYNVRDNPANRDASDRLVAVLDCEKAYVFCTSTSPAQAVGLYQAFDRLIQDKQAAYMQSLRDIEKHVRRESTVVPTRFGPAISSVNSPAAARIQLQPNKTSISLHTDVVLTLGTMCFGVFPGTFFDSQILKLEANDIQARFAVGLAAGRIHSGLGMTLGQLQVALASVRRATAIPKALDISVDDVVNSALNAKGGIILRVPKVIASMQTWQDPQGNSVDYIFKSLFDGKIDVGWNLSRINFIKGMWVSHSRSLGSRLGKALPASAVKISASTAEDDTMPTGTSSSSSKQEKITAQVNLPQSRYEYRALEPPVIETPQLRDMGEATPPLEWIGLNRDRLPNVTHQIIIVSLVEVAKEVEDAYERILGSS